ncbi:MFS transporter [Blastopirellula marina]|uniref:D-galactonate transporter n=1 Tax=Blastopirellula marina DSM 3645 TaxID=314230 RepID=A3ZVB6_9BACT|nr:MFS transporter [Blastopirellula marina]EAQ79262.1 D-galactonate transporter [Blastopirellula marina DSM 3645]
MTMKSASSATLLTLMVIAIGVNYIDRGSLSIVKTDVAAEFELSSVQMGWLFSAFFWSYALSQVATGWLVDRFDVKWLYAGGFLVWSLATVSMAMSGSFAIFLLLRLVLGVGESIAYPATSRMIVMNFPERRRGIANALIDAATKLGPMLALLFGGLLVANSGWRSLFVVVGLGGLLWLPAWLWLVPSQQKPTIDAPKARTNVPFSELFKRQEVWGTSLGFFCLGYTWAFLLSWLPAYLEESRHFSKESMALFGSLPFAAMAVTSLCGGWLADRWIHAGASATLARKVFLIGGLVLCSVFMFASVLTPDPRACILLLCLACASLGFYTSNVWAVTQTLAGPNAAGQWTGLQNAIGNIGGAISPALTGWLVQETGSYYSAFAAASVMLVVGVFAYVGLVRQIVPLDWDDEKQELQGALR